MKKIVFAIISFAALVACAKEKQMPTAIGLEPSTLSIAAQGGAQSTTVITNAEGWNAGLDGKPDWCSLTASGSVISVEAKPNSSIEPRSAFATVTTTDGKSIVLGIVQAGADKALEADSELALLSPDGAGQVKISITSNVGEWTAALKNQEDASWVALSSDNDGITLKPVSANTTGSRREATVLVSSKAVFDDDGDGEKEGLVIWVTVRQHPHIN